MTAIGRREEIVEALAPFNTMPECEGGDELYGPGICIQLPPGSEPITQMLMTITEDEIAWQVIARLVKELPWKLMDPQTGRVLGTPHDEA
ncbi:MAG: hypothetical protein ACYTGC_02165 [Planctomycetota bacterium]